MTQPYKGVRDFYPEDQRVQRYIADAMRRAVEAYGYEEMNGSVLEPTELYASKTSEEIVSEQTYTFTDRGDRSVTLRPEMTPTVARMVAAKRRELGYPLRWYSFQNFFRYERPQRGRLREFWQLNADLIGASNIEADAEIIALAARVMAELGAHQDDYRIRVSSRAFLDSVYERVGIPTEDRPRMTRLLDAKDKRGVELDASLAAALEDTDSFSYFVDLSRILKEQGIAIHIDASIARGFDYYTGMVFEVFDTSNENPRSLFGGGRYDTLIEKYGGEAVPAVGFGMGDVTVHDFLSTHHLLPKLESSAHLYLAPIGAAAREAWAAADRIRIGGANVALGMKHERLADHIRNAEKLGIPYFAAFGDDEAASETLTIKHLSTGTETKLSFDSASAFLLGAAPQTKQ